MIPLMLGIVVGAYYGAGIANSLNERTVIIKETTTVTTTKIPEPAKPALKQKQRPGQRQEQRQGQRQESVQVKPQGSARTKKRNAQRKRSKARKAQETIESLAITQTTNAVIVTPGVRSIEVKQIPV